MSARTTTSRAGRVVAAGVLVAMAIGSAGPAAAQASAPGVEGDDAAVTAPVAEPVAEPTAEPVVEPVVEPVAEPTAEPVAEPVAEPTAEPAAEPVAEPVAPAAARTAAPAAVVADVPVPVVTPPTVRDGALTVVRGEHATFDLDDLVTPGSGAIVAVDIEQWRTSLGVTYDEVSHVVSLAPTEIGQFTLTFSARGETAGAIGVDERSASGTLNVTVTPDAANVDPVISWAAVPDASTTSTTARFAVTSDQTDVTLGYVLDLPEGAQSASATYPGGLSFEITGLAVGRHTIRVVVEHGEGWSALDYAWDVVATAAPAPAPAAPVLAATAIPAQTIARGIRSGARGESVAIIQRVVGASPDGRFGRATRAAVVAFQRAHGLVADGIVGPKTWAAIVAVANGAPVPAAAASSAIPASQVARGIRQGARGESVAVIQRIVGASADGRFGPQTRAAVRAWQRAHGLVADGIVGRLTWAAMTAA